MPFVSIIICTYNSENTISRCLQSIVPLITEKIELVVMDGGSTDNTNTLVKEFIRSNHHLLVKHRVAQDDGIYDAINKGIQISAGKYVMLLHSDDCFSDSGSFQVLLDSISQNTYDIFLCPIEIISRNLKRFKYPVNENYRFWLLIGHMPPHPGMIIKRSLFTNNNFYSCDYKISGDFEWCLRNFVLENKWRICVLEDLSFYEMYSGGVSSSGVGSFLQITKELSSIYSTYQFSFPAVRAWLRLIPKVILRMR
jgi:glycosyltransferase involved in cell wall biosynthesis